MLVEDDAAMLGLLMGADLFLLVDQDLKVLDMLLTAGTALEIFPEPEVPTIWIDSGGHRGGGVAMGMVVAQGRRWLRGVQIE